ncbi:MAG: rhomboid family intramembrane serine protease [Saprospiraceae bacterium]|nr:rhomboid family intramembrane serine protease [Saprospiraceae bacterium]
MFESIYKDIRYKIQTGNFWVRSIVLCTVIFILVNLTKAYFTFSNAGFPGALYYDVIQSISLSSEWKHNLLYIWVWITHIFLHEGFFHLLWNMLWLYWLSAIVEDLIGKRHAILIFFEAAIFGGIFFIISTHFIPWYEGMEIHASGASAAICGLLFAAATISPSYGIRLFLIGNVEIKYIAIFVLIMDLILAGQVTNSGGHFAHIGGAIWGWLYILLLRQGVAMDGWLDYFISDKTPSKYQKPKETRVRQTKFKQTPSKEEKLNRILDKIKTQGIEKLTPEEREFLDQMSKE